MAWSGALVDFKDGVTYTGAANSDTSPTFTLLGGRYAMAVYSSGTASAQLNILMPDGTHFVACSAAATTTTAVFDLPPGSYQIVVGASGGTQQGSLVRIPFRAA